jgi:hypothetical protein
VYYFFLDILINFVGFFVIVLTMFIISTFGIFVYMFSMSKEYSRISLLRSMASKSLSGGQCFASCMCVIIISNCVMFLIIVSLVYKRGHFSN